MSQAAQAAPLSSDLAVVAQSNTQTTATSYPPNAPPPPIIVLSMLRV